MRVVYGRDARYWKYYYRILAGSSDPFVEEEVREVYCRGYLLPCEGAFVEIVEEMKSACGEGCNKGSWHGAK